MGAAGEVSVIESSNTVREPVVVKAKPVMPMGVESRAEDL
jgi:hypothetical protein